MVQGTRHEKIKVAFGINKLAVGGAERILIREIQGLDSARFDARLITLLPTRGPSLDDTLLHLGNRWKRCTFAGIFDLVSWWKLYRYLKREQFDVVIGNLFFAGLMLRTAAIAAGVPVILQTELNVYKRNLFWRMVERALAPYTYSIIGNSKEILETTPKMLGLPQEKFFLNYSTVDLKEVRPATNDERAAAHAKYGVQEDARVIVTAGRLVEQKGHTHLIDAFAALPEALRANARLFIFGEGVLRETILAQVNERGLQDVIVLPGTAPITEVFALADVFVLPSLWEGMPVVLVEAMAAGLPIIATDVSGSRELVIEGKNGYLVPPANVPALAKRLEVFLQDSALRRTLGAAAREEAKQYSVERHVARLSQLIEEALQHYDRRKYV